jgi:hypothetical protein
MKRLNKNNAPFYGRASTVNLQQSGSDSELLAFAMPFRKYVSPEILFFTCSLTSFDVLIRNCGLQTIFGRSYACLNRMQYFGRR